MPTVIVQHLGDRRQAVGGAGGFEYVVLRRIVCLSWLTPITTVMSWFFAGAEMITFFAPPSDVLLAAFRGP